VKHSYSIWSMLHSTSVGKTNSLTEVHRIRNKVLSYAMVIKKQSGSMNMAVPTLAVDFGQLPKVMSPRTLKSLAHWSWTLGNCRKSIAEIQYCHIHVSQTISQFAPEHFMLSIRSHCVSVMNFMQEVLMTGENCLMWLIHATNCVSFTQHAIVSMTAKEKAL
jgi:hypothetical protein